MKPLTIETICNVVGGTLLGSGDTQTLVDTIVTDSRKITSGDFFVPIKGETFDGHSFLPQVYEKGAVCSFSAVDFMPPQGKTCIRVVDTRIAMGDLARYLLEGFHVPVVAVTGSVGKTTTKNMIASVLAQKYSVHKTEGNFNNDLGLPLTVFDMTQNHEVAVLEMGMSAFGEIHYLSSIAKPDIGVITNVGIAHIEYLGSRDGILKAKSEIFDFMKPDGVAVLNGDNDKLQELEGNLSFPIDWVGMENKKGIWAKEVVSNGIQSISCTVVTPKGDMGVTIPVPGEHMVSNALLATAVGLRLGLTLAEIKEGIETFASDKMRMAMSKTKGGFTMIDDTYNANPISMKASVDVLSGATGRKVAVLGDMYELGAEEEKLHGEVGAYAVEKGIDVLVALGPISAAMAQGAKQAGGKMVYHYDTQEEFWKKGLGIFQKNDTILIKASRGMHLEKTVEKIQGVE